MTRTAPLATGSVTGDAENPGGFVHMPALDGVRGVAILLVLFDHLFWSNTATGSRLLDFVGAVRRSSWVGVNLFFVLSGFLITGILLDSLGVQHYFKTFYARRVLRIFPLYYGVLIALLLLTRPMHLVWGGRQYYFLTYTSNLFIWWHAGPFDLGHFNINHFWSLQVEEQFYLVWPLVIFRVRNPGSVVRIALIGCAAALLVRVFLVAMSGHPAFSDPNLVYGFTPACVDNILFGCFLCAVLRTSFRAAILRLAPRVLAVAAVALLGVAVVNGDLSWVKGAHPAAYIFMATAGFSLVGMACSSTLAMALISGSRTQRLFKNRILRFFGKYSYGLYVYHFSISGWLQAPLRAFFRIHTGSKGLSVVLEACTAGVISVLVAVLSYHLFEVRFLHLKRFFSYGGFAVPAAPAEQAKPA